MIWSRRSRLAASIKCQGRPNSAVKKVFNRGSAVWPPRSNDFFCGTVGSSLAFDRGGQTGPPRSNALFLAPLTVPNYRRTRRWRCLITDGRPNPHLNVHRTNSEFYSMLPVFAWNWEIWITLQAMKLKNQENSRKNQKPEFSQNPKIFKKQSKIQGEPPYFQKK